MAEQSTSSGVGGPVRRRGQYRKYLRDPAASIPRTTLWLQRKSLQGTVLSRYEYLYACVALQDPPNYKTADLHS